MYNGILYIYTACSGWGFYDASGLLRLRLSLLSISHRISRHRQLTKRKFIRSQFQCPAPTSRRSIVSPVSRIFFFGRLSISLCPLIYRRKNYNLLLQNSGGCCCFICSPLCQSVFRGGLTSFFLFSSCFYTPATQAYIYIRTTSALLFDSLIVYIRTIDNNNLDLCATPVVPCPVVPRWSPSSCFVILSLRLAWMVKCLVVDSSVVCYILIEPGNPWTSSVAGHISTCFHRPVFFPTWPPLFGPAGIIY
jgi:hypothetical protein